MAIRVSECHNWCKNEKGHTPKGKICGNNERITQQNNANVDEDVGAEGDHTAIS